MNAERFELVRELFLLARDLPPAQAAALLAERCGGDDEVRLEVESLIETHLASSDGSHVVDKPLVGDRLAQAVAEVGEGGDGDTPEPLPEQVGPYRVVGLIGEGGMGRVFEARQVRPDRRVAVKVVRSAFPTRRALQRFEREAELLARLHHPGIAQVYESGTFVSGPGGAGGKGAHPYFAMEFVEGPSLSRYVRDRRPDRAQRLGLVAQVCDAVHHAHLRGVVHRDLKPGNILIEGGGGTGEGLARPKVLDFGVARALESETGVSMQTEAGQIVGTLAYMSPEQVVGAGGAVDPRCDVYSLGVILYELLTGKLPHNVATSSIAEAARTIQHDAPTRPSAVVHDLRGDLETIVLKALERDPARRYQSAADLADDLRRFTSHRPINARPPTRWYLFSTFARRNRGLVAGSAAAVLTLVAGLSVSLVLYLQADQARRAAETSNTAAGRARDRAEGINTFLVEDLLKLAAEDDDARSMKLYDAVKRAAGSIDKRFEGHPETGSSVRSLVGTMMDRFGDYEAAIALHRRASEELASRLGPDAPETLEARYNLAMGLLGNADQAAAETVLRDLADRRGRVYGAGDPLTLETKSMLAEAIQAQGRPEEAEKLLREVVPLLRAAEAKYAPTLCNALGNLGSILRNQRKFDESEKVLTEAVEVARTLNRPLSPAMIMNTFGLAAVYASTKRFSECEQTVTELLPPTRRAFGDQSYEVAMMLNLRGKSAYQRGDLAHAEEDLVGAFEMCDRVLGRKRYETELLNTPLLSLYKRKGDDTKLEVVLKRAVELRESIQAEPRHASVLGIKEEYASFLLAHGRTDEAKAVIEPVLPLAIQFLPEGDPVRVRVVTTAVKCGLTAPHG